MKNLSVFFAVVLLFKSWAFAEVVNFEEAKLRLKIRPFMDKRFLFDNPNGSNSVAAFHIEKPNHIHLERYLTLFIDDGGTLKSIVRAVVETEGLTTRERDLLAEAYAREFPNRPSLQYLIIATSDSIIVARPSFNGRNKTEEVTTLSLSAGRLTVQSAIVKARRRFLFSVGEYRTVKVLPQARFELAVAYGNQSALRSLVRDAEEDIEKRQGLPSHERCERELIYGN